MALLNPYSAVIAKAKAKYGNRLTQKDYNALVKCASVGEVVQYLKSYTYYQNYLGKVSNDIHRGNLEAILREKLFDNYLSLCRYNSDDSPVTEHIIRNTEINELMKFITLLSIGKPEEYLFSLPLYFMNHTEIDLRKLSRARTHGEMLSAVKGTLYECILKEHRPNAENVYDIALIADRLEIAVLQELYNDIEKMKSKKEKEQLKSLLTTLCDYHNYSRIMRMKRYYHMNNEALKTHLIPFGTFVRKRLDDILMKETYEGVRDAFSKTKVGRKAADIDIDSEMAIQGRYEMCRHQLYFSTSPEVVLLAYYIVAETELKNVITIIEGIRYSMMPKNIQEILII